MEIQSFFPYFIIKRTFISFDIPKDDRKSGTTTSSRRIMLDRMYFRRVALWVEIIVTGEITPAAIAPSKRWMNRQQFPTFSEVEILSLRQREAKMPEE